MESDHVLLVAAILAGLGLLAAPRVRAALGAARRYRGTRIVLCPADERPAAVAVDALAAAGIVLRHGSTPALELSRCSRWPERAGCGAPCLRQIEAAPEDCLLRSIATRWYEGRSCALCRRAIHPLSWAERPPGLRAPDGDTLLWRDAPPERVPELLRTHAPLCWDCHVAESFRRLYPQLVLERAEPRRRR